MQNFIQFKKIKIENSTYLLLLSSIILLAHVIPVTIQQTPSGTDVYSHMFYTKIMLDSKSLYEFYNKCLEKGYLGYDYPFGLWLFGALIGKITGIDLYTISFFIPLLLVFIITGIYYAYSGIFIDSKKYRILSVILLLSMPNISTGILNYQTSIFVISILLFIFYLTLNRNISYNRFIPLLILSVFILCFTHTGTYMFLLFFSVTCILVYGVLCREFNNRLFVLVLTVLFVYGITTSIFPYVHPQYIDKARLVITVGEFLSSKLYLPLAYDMSQLFYTRVFLDKSLIDIALWSGLIYGIAKLAIFLSIQISKLLRKITPQTPLFAIPFIGEIRHISHSVFATPFWIGPIHTFFSLIALFRLNKETLSLLISILMVTILPGSQVTSYTGALREIFYLFLIIPITSSLGFIYLESKLRKFTNRRMSLVLTSLFIFGIFSALLVMPIIGNMYYKPSISGSDVERSGLKWLRGIGNADEGCTGLGYRHMINIYGNKEVPSSTTVHSGSEMKHFIRDLREIYFFNKGENYVEDIYSSFNVKYFILSDRVLRTFGAKREELTIHENKELDKIHSNDDFDIYQYITPEYTLTHENITKGIVFNETCPEIKDAGVDFLIETPGYKIRLSKKSPSIKYLGSKEENLLGEGYLLDYLRISWYSREYLNKFAEYVPSEMNFSTIIQGNQIIYKRVLRNQNKTEKWATLIIKYQFYRDAIKNEMIIANDHLPVTMNLYLSTMTLTPLNYFTYKDWYGKKKERRIYPSEGYVRIKNKKFRDVFLHNKNKGIYMRYGNTAPYPSNIYYLGSIGYNYSSVNIDYERFIQPGDSLHITRYISIGDEDTTEKNVDRYLSVGLYPYQEGIIPLIITGYLERLNHSTEKELNSSFYVYRELKYANVTYTEGVNMGNEEINKTIMNKLLSYGIDVIGYENFFYRFTDPLQIQKEKIGDMRRNARVYYNLNISGFIPKGLRYNLDTINASIDENITFIIATSVEPPIEEFNREGLRYPKIVYYHGNKTSLILLPVSNPTSSLLRPEYNIEDILSQWKSTIDSAIREDDLCIFLLRSTRIRGYMNEILDLIDYAKNKGMTFTTPEKIAEHFRLLQNIYATVSKDIDSVNIFIKNNNNRPVKGVTFRVTVPTIEWRCPYRAINGRITRIKREGLNCISYVTTNLSEKENKTVIIEPNITRREFNIEIPENPIEGKIRIKIMDEYNNSVGSALVTIENKLYKTDEDGVLNINLRRGKYIIKIKKPGFKTEIFDLEVKGKIYSIFGYF